MADEAAKLRELTTREKEIQSIKEKNNALDEKSIELQEKRLNLENQYADAVKDGRTNANKEYKSNQQRLDVIERIKEIPDFSPWMDRCASWRDKYDPVTPEMFDQAKHVNQYAFVRILSEQMKKDDILVGDCGGNIVVINHCFKTKTGQRYFTNNGNSPMGFSFAGAIGAWFASDKEKQNVVCIIGDGGMNMNYRH